MSELNVMDPNIESISVFKQIVRADGTREDEVLAAYMDRDPEKMERVIKEQNVEGRVVSGQYAVDLLNSVPPEDAERICKLNERADQCE